MKETAMKNNELPKVVYIAGINLSGLWSKKPLMAKLNNYSDSYSTSWYDSSGNVCVNKLGIDHRGGLITFASIDKKEVQIWIDGVLSCQKLLRNWVK